MPLGVEVGLGPGHIVLDGDPAPPRKGAQQPPTFRSMSIVAKRSPISATVELLYQCKIADGCKSLVRVCEFWNLYIK